MGRRAEWDRGLSTVLIAVRKLSVLPPFRIATIADKGWPRFHQKRLRSKRYRGGASSTVVVTGPSGNVSAIS